MDFKIKKPTHWIALAVVIFTLSIVILSPILTFVGAAPSIEDIELSEPLIIVSAVITILIFLGTPFLWYLLVNKFSIKEMLSSLKIRKQGLDMAILWAVMAVIIMFAFTIAMGFLISQLGVAEDDVTNIKDLASNLSVFSMFFIIVFQSAGEEIFFRGFLLEKINSVAGKEIAIVSTAILFGVAHLSYGKIYPAIMTAILGIILAYVVIKTKNLNAAIFAHILFNAASFTIFFIGRSLGLEALMI